MAGSEAPSTVSHRVQRQWRCAWRAAPCLIGRRCRMCRNSETIHRYDFTWPASTRCRVRLPRKSIANQFDRLRWGRHRGRQGFRRSRQPPPPRSASWRESKICPLVRGNIAAGNRLEAHLQVSIFALSLRFISTISGYSSRIILTFSGPVLAVGKRQRTMGSHLSSASIRSAAWPPSLANVSSKSSIMVSVPEC